MQEAKISHVAVIGTGTIGASWTALFLARGLTVAASDPAPQAEITLRRFVDTAWPALRRLGAADSPPQHRLSFHADSNTAVADAEFVQENAPERESLKREIFRELDAATQPSVVIATSSSGLLISRLQAGCRHPERFIIGHPFNPPHLMLLVEVVGGVQTAPEVVERALAIYTALGKRPIHVRREVKGHIANRLQAALWREAVHLVAEGVATVSDVDTAISEGPGIRWALMGPNLIFHLGGGPGGMRDMLE
jgi:carnitine 3-dehydrogenase